MYAYMSSLLRDETKYLQLEYPYLIIIHKIAVPDGHRYIPEFEWSENVHSYILVFIFCFDLLVLCFDNH